MNITYIIHTWVLNIVLNGVATCIIWLNLFLYRIELTSILFSTTTTLNIDLLVYSTPVECMQVYVTICTLGSIIIQIPVFLISSIYINYNALLKSEQLLLHLSVPSFISFYIGGMYSCINIVSPNIIQMLQDDRSYLIQGVYASIGQIYTVVSTVYIYSFIITIFISVYLILLIFFIYFVIHKQCLYTITNRLIIYILLVGILLVISTSVVQIVVISVFSLLFIEYLLMILIFRKTI